jgi:hypothetical protein
MYDAKIGRWLTEDPIGFDAGDPNLYRYVGNNPANAVDPTGLSDAADMLAVGTPSPMTEALALGILKDEIKRWKGNGWNFAAHLLQHFIDKKGPKDYTLTQEDKDEVMEQSERLVKKVIYKAIWDDERITCNNLGDASIKFSGHVNWWPQATEKLAISLAGGSGDTSDINNALFYAYGGADLKLEGHTKNLTVVQRPSGRVWFQFDVQAKVTISDDYTFEPEGRFGSRLWFDAYRAANFLETKLPDSPYKKFNDSVTFEKLYTGLRSDQIQGGAFHEQRPIR